MNLIEETRIIEEECEESFGGCYEIKQQFLDKVSLFYVMNIVQRKLIEEFFGRDIISKWYSAKCKSKREKQEKTEMKNESKKYPKWWTKTNRMNYYEKCVKIMKRRSNFYFWKNHLRRIKNHYKMHKQAPC